ncbi:sensor histidine kinase [Mongoliitalea lutea]|nr:histidine kinase N-terminal 7TM domain-containing protein [Mongoliitalea lutea]
MEFNVFSITLLISGLTVAIISLVLVKRLDKNIRWFSMTMLLVSFWSIAYGFELASNSLTYILFWIKLEYIGIAFAPATWLWFCIVYTNRERLQKKRFLYLIFFIPLLTFLMVITNDYHYFHYREIELDKSGPFPLLAITPGPWYFVHTLFFYFSLFTGNYLLFLSFKNAEKIYRKQISFLIAAGILPWFINFLYLLGIRPFEHIDLTPYAFLSIYIVVGFGLLKFDLFELKPIARHKTLEVIDKGIMVFDPLNRLIDINIAAIKLLGKNNGTLIGMHCRQLLEVYPNLIKAIESKEKVKLELIKIKQKGFLAVETTLIKDQKDNHLGVLLLIDDISQLKANQSQIQQQSKELQELNKLKDRLFSIISHDLKGPIQSLNELMKLTNRGIVTKDEFFEILPDISKNVDNVSILMHNLLAWSSSQLKGEVVNKKEFDISELVDQTFELFINRAIDKGINFKTEKPKKVIVYADKNMIDLVLRNLVSNSLKFSGIGDQVRILVEDKNNTVSIEVVDTGLGINAENIKKLNSGESFSTLGKNNESGTGLGILLVKDYLKKNESELVISSEVKKGSSFYFELPKKAIGP